MELHWAAVDVETTGLSSARDSLCEVALVTETDRHTHSGWSSLVRNQRSARLPGAARVHGLRPAQLRQAPSADSVLAELHRRLGTVGFVLAHNASFDLAFLGEAFRSRGFAPPGPAFYCTLRLAKAVLPELDRHGLDAIRRELGLSTVGAHRALADARAVADLFRHLIDRCEGDVERLVALHGPPLAFRWSAARRGGRS